MTHYNKSCVSLKKYAHNLCEDIFCIKTKNLSAHIATAQMQKHNNIWTCIKCVHITCIIHNINAFFYTT